MPAWMLPAAMIGSELLGGLFGNNAQRKNQRSADRRYRDMTGRIDREMGGLQGPNEWEMMLRQFLGDAQKTGAPKDLTAETYDPSMIDLDRLMQRTPEGIASSDALMQFLRRSPADQLGGAYGTLTELAETGGASNVNKLFDALEPLQLRRTDQAASRLNAGVASLGQRGGTASRIGEASLRTGMGMENNAMNAGIMQEMLEAASGRRLQAAGTLGGLMEGFSGQRLGAMSQLTGIDEAMRAMLGGAMGQNASAANTAGQWNAGSRSNTAASNRDSMTQFMQMMMNGMGMGGGMAATRMGQRQGLLGLLSGQQLPQQSLTNPLIDSAQMAMLLPMLLGQLRGGKPAPKAGG